MSFLSSDVWRGPCQRYDDENEDEDEDEDEEEDDDVVVGLVVGVAALQEIY